MAIYVPQRAIVPAPAKAMTGVGAAAMATQPMAPWWNGQQKTQQFMRAAAGYWKTDPWIRAAERVISGKFSTVDWVLEDADDTEIDDEYPDPKYQVPRSLLERPQAALAPEDRQVNASTRRDMWSITSRHMGACGTAFWYLDQLEPQARTPLAILYIAPWRMWPAFTKGGNLTGWVLDWNEQTESGTPLELDQVIPFYLEPPDEGAFAPGLVQSAMALINLDSLAMQHAANVLTAGGRLAGIVSAKDSTSALPDDKFQQLVRDFRTINELPDAARRTNIVQGPIDFNRTAATLSELELIPLMAAVRDDLLALWGVPFSQIGGSTSAGLNSGDIRKYDEAALWQNAVHLRLVPFAETLQYRLLDRYQQLGITVELEIEEPEFDDDGPRFELLAKSQGTPMRTVERRALIGLEPFGDPELDNEIWMPSTLTVVAIAPDEKGNPVLGTQIGIEGPPGADMSLSAKAELDDYLDLTQEEIDAEIFDDGIDDWEDGAEAKAAGPKYIFGRLNPAYQSTASASDVSSEKAAIRKRAESKFPGRKITDAMVNATYKRNLARKQKQGITARAKRKFGRSPTTRAVANTLRRNMLRDKRLAALFGGGVPAKAALENALTRLRDRIDAEHTGELKTALADFLERQKADIASRLRVNADHIARKPRESDAWFAKARWDRELTTILARPLTAMAQNVSEHISQRLTPVKAAPAGTVDRALSRGAARVTKINERTRQAVQDFIVKGLEEGSSPADLADEIEAGVLLDNGSLAFDELRAETIARTELMDAYNGAALGSYSDAGIEMVQAIDGDGDEECADRNGREFTVLEADLIEDHPNGTLDWVPIIPDESPVKAAPIEAPMRIGPVLQALSTAIASEDAANEQRFMALADAAAEREDRMAHALETFSQVAHDISNRPIHVEIPPLPTPRPVTKRVLRDEHGRITGIEEMTNGE